MSELETLRLPSRFDYSFHRQFGEMYTPIVEGSDCNEIILDFTQVEYLDSSALGMMVLLQKKFSGKNGRIKIPGDHRIFGRALWVGMPWPWWMF